MKPTLDNPIIFEQLDTLDVSTSIKSAGEQFESAWHESQFVGLNFEIESINNIVYVGMGGSNLAAHVALSLSPLLLKKPFEIISNFRLPQYVSHDTLLILSSYSGNTQEVLSCAQDAISRKGKVVVITTGGKLKDIAINQHLPLILLNEKLNRSHVSRFGIGLTLGAVMGLMVRINPPAFKFVDPKEIVRILEKSFALLAIGIPTENNPAKQFAQKNVGQSIVIISANHLSGVGKILSNYLNETAKTFSTHFSIPDLNHHLLEGLVFPSNLKDNTRFILLNSSLYPELIQNRFKSTKNVLLKQNYQLTEIKPESTEIISQVFESLAFLIMISYYLSILNKQNPGTNPWADYFKNNMTDNQNYQSEQIQKE